MAKPRKCPAPSRGPSSEQVEEILEGMYAFVLQDPRYGALFDILLEAGGVGVAATEEPDLAEILDRGYLQSGQGAQRAKGYPIACHENAARLWHDNPDQAVIVTGWALSKDGLWRQHSWVTNSVDGQIYETTEPRVAYFGFALTPKESQRFYEGNVLHRR